MFNLFRENEPLKKDYQPSDEHLRAIGRVAVEWSRLDASIEVAIWTMLYVTDACPSPWHNEREGRAVTTHASFLNRLDMLMTLLRVRRGDYLADELLRPVIAKIKEAYPKRNNIVHATWTVTPAVTIRQAHRARGRLVPSYDKLSADDINAIADDIAALEQIFRKAMGDITEILVTSSDC